MFDCQRQGYRIKLRNWAPFWRGRGQGGGLMACVASEAASVRGELEYGVLEYRPSPSRATRVFVRLLAPAAVLGAAGLAPASALATPTNCHMNPYRASDAALAACGYQVSPVQSAVVNSDGSIEYDFTVGGLHTSELQPPPGFDPLTASPAERARFGI